jgi:hypothetical protein
VLPVSTGSCSRKVVLEPTYHGVSEEGAPTREIAEGIGRSLNVSAVSKSHEAARDHFGWIALFFGMTARLLQTQGLPNRDWTSTTLDWRQGLMSGLH